MKLLPILILLLVVLACSNSPRSTRTTPRPKATPALTEKEKVVMRHGYAKNLERNLLSEGHDFYVTVRGKKQDQLHIKYILMSRPFVYQLANSDSFQDTVEGLGFTKIIATDGYRDTWTIDLK